MKAIKNALVVMDKPKHDQVAFRRALRLQKQEPMHLHLVAFCYHPMYDQTEVFETHQRNEIKKEVLREREEWLRNQVLDAGAAFENVTIEVVWTKDLADWVTARAEKDIDLVVKTVHRSRTLTHTPADWTLLRACPAPVLLCTKKRWPKQAQILVALDMKREDAAHKRLNQKALDAASYFARLHGATIHCVYAVEVSSVLADLDIIQPKKIQKEAKARAEAAIKTLLAPYDIPMSRVHIPVGKVGQAVNNIAAKVKADMLVMGTTGRTGVKGLVLGNAAEKVLTRAGCDILALKP
ncbi:MAG: universal stress protein [Pseudomonadales bacterium]|nr:universal stress protein [Pseudomonadales bacterium]